MSEYRYIRVPPPVVLLDDNKDPIREMSFFEFLQTRIRDNKHFGSNISGILAAISLEKEFRDKEPGYVAKISNSEFSFLSNSVTDPDPSKPYNVSVVVQLTSFIFAVTKASEEPLNVNAAT